MKYAEVIELINRYPERRRAPRSIESAIEMRERLTAAGILRPAGPVDRSFAEIHQTAPLARGSFVALDQAGIDDAARTIWGSADEQALPRIIASADPRVAARLHELARRNGLSLQAQPA